MIVGDGDIGTALNAVDKPNRLFLASGVSNSQCTDESEYEREIKLLEDQNKDFRIVYFSTLALFYSDTRYVQHKWQMESLIKEWFPKYNIVRLGNITWGTNPNTLINYLKAHPDAEIRDEYRYIVDLDEFLHWVDLIPDWNCEMNITGKRMKVRDIYERYCSVPTK